MPRADIQRKQIMRTLNSLKKIANLVQKTKIENPNKTVGLMFEDEASFRRINKPKCAAGCNNKIKPCVQVCFWYGGASNGGKIFLVMPNCNTNNNTHTAIYTRNEPH